jgi:hypothetical protein
MYRGQMTYEIKQAIFSGSNLLLQLLIGERRKILVQAADYKLPGIECGKAKEFFVCHRNLLFLVNVGTAIV